MGKASVYTSHDPRAKLLNRLGIYKGTRTPETPRRKHVLQSTRTGTGTGTTRSIIGNVVPTLEPLNDTHERISRRTRIQFNNDVKVVQIPSRHEYSNRIKKFLWSNGNEISENAERNRVEYASEGWDWHTVLEDDEMYVDANTGELVHPCWFEFDEDAMDTYESSSEDEYLAVEGPSLSRSDSCIGLDQLMSECLQVQ
jgi:hypothetical protein